MKAYFTFGDKNNTILKNYSIYYSFYYPFHSNNFQLKKVH